MTKKNGKVEETTELAAAAEAGLPVEMPANWGNEEKILQGERLVPKLHLMQGQSKLVAEEKAKMGDMVNLVTGMVIGSTKEPVEFVPIKKLPSTWVIYDRVKDERTGQSKRVFKEIIDVTPQNSGWEWTVKDTTGEVVQENDYCINFLTFLPKDPFMPVVISFKRTSVKAGKKVVNHFDVSRAQGIAPAARTLKLLALKEMKDGQPYFKFDLDPTSRASTKEDMAKAYQFFQLYKDQQVKVDNSDLMDTAGADVHVDAEVSDNSQY